MVKNIVALAIVTSLLLPMPVAKEKDKSEWKQIDNCRITSYCPVCNDGQGYESSSGVELRYGYAASSWLPEGTLVSIEGEVFEIVDKCGTEAIDIFIDTDDTICHCNLNEYKDVMVKLPEGKHEK